MALTPEEKHERRIDRLEQTLKCLQLNKAINNVAAEFQRFIKLSESDEYGTVTCVTCGVQGDWNATKGVMGALFDAGHFYSRKHAATIFCPMNVHVQCVGCNRYKSGNLDEYRKYMEARYSQEQLEWLHLEHFKIKQWTRRELAELKAGYLDGIKREKERIA